MITIEEFRKIEMVVGEIKDVREHPNADRLYVLKVAIGTEERQLVAGIRAAYTKEQLAGRQVIIVKNLQPAVIRGEESNGMVLAVTDEKGITLLGLERQVALGSMVR